MIDNSVNHSKTHQLSNKSRNSSLDDEIDKLSIPNAVKIQIKNNINSATETKTTRKTPRKKLLFQLAYTACMENKIKFDPDILAQEIGLTHKETAAAVKQISGTTRTYNNFNNCSIPIVAISPSEYVENMCYRINDIFPDKQIFKHIDPIKKICEEIIKKNRYIIDENPEYVALGVIWYYIELYEFNIQRKQFQKIFGVCDATIKNFADMVKELDNC